MRAHFLALGTTLAVLALVQACSSSEQTDSAQGSHTAAESDRAAGASAAAGSPARPGSPGAAGASSAATASKGAAPSGSTHPSGRSDFTSAEPPPVGKLVPGVTASTGKAMPVQPGDKPANVTEADEIKRGDIYYVLSEQRIVNLNRFRGLQILDVSNVNQPRIEGHLPMAGEPVELYVIGQRVLVLYNAAVGYYGAPDSPSVELAEGAMILSVDIQDRTAPRLLGRTTLPGSILTSRLTRKDGRAALYVVSADRGEHKVTSFDVTDGALSRKNELALDVGVEDAQATTDWLMIVRAQGIDLIDVSMPDGTMTRRGVVTPDGAVTNRFDVGVFGGFLHAVSSSATPAVDHVQVFNLVDPQHPALQATCELRPSTQAAGSSAERTSLLLGDRAFVASHGALRVASISEAGACTVHPSYVANAQDTFLRPVQNGMRLVGIAQGVESKLTLSLYDAANLDNAMPLLARADIDLQNVSSSATWDDRAFTVLDDAVSVMAEDGTVERGMILLPFSDPLSAQTQILTFSDHTLTKRGTMNHGTVVNRAFQLHTATTANLSDSQLSLFDTTDTNAARELSRLDIAPEYARVLVFGDRVARVRESTLAEENARVQILERSADLDGSTVLTSFEVPRGSAFYQLGTLLVTLSMTPSAQVQVYDLSVPERPRKRGSLQTDVLKTLYEDEIFAAGFSASDKHTPVEAGMATVQATTGGGSQSFVIGNLIALVGTQSRTKVLGKYRECVQSVPVCTASETATCPASHFEGAITCKTPEGGTESCTGSISQCDANGCKPLAQPPADAVKVCEDHQESREWRSFMLDTLDVSDPDKPALYGHMDFPEDEEATSALVAGNTLYLSYQKAMSGNMSERVVKQYARAIEFRDASAVAMGQPVNLPGRMIHARDKTLYTQGYEWNSGVRHTSLARLQLAGSAAYLESSQMIGDREVSSIRVEDATGHIVVSSSVVVPGLRSDESRQYKLTLLDDKTLAMLSDTDLNVPATYAAAVNGRGLFVAAHGLLIYDIQDPAHLKALAFYPRYTSQRDLFFDGNQVIFASGVYGVQHFDATQFNLLTH